MLKALSRSGETSAPADEGGQSDHFELVDQHEGPRGEFIPERTHGRQGQDVGDTGALEHVDVGAVVDAGGR